MYIGDHFTADERGKPNAVSALGVSLGLVLGFPLVSFLMAHFGWAMSFHLLALLNLLLGLALVRLFVHPLPLSSSSRPADPQPVLNRVWRTFALAWRTPMLGWILLIEIATLSYLWGSSAWLPAYLTDEKGFSIKQMGWMAALPFIVSIASKYLGGVLLDRIRPYQAPLIFVCGGAATALCIYGVMHSHQLGWIAFFLLAANACWGRRARRYPRCCNIMRGRRRSAAPMG